MMQRQTVSRSVLSGMYWIPADEVDPHRVRQHFTVEKRGIDFETRRPTVEHIEIFREDPKARPGMIGLPIAEGMDLFPSTILEEDLSDGAPFTSWTRRPDPNHPRAAEGQARFMDLTTDALDSLYTVLAKAETGSGKTVVALDQAARLGVRTLVLVPLARLKDQWINQTQDILGVPRDRIGEVVGPKCQWGRDVVVAMMKSVAVREYPPEFYRAFGLVIYDETHNLGAYYSSRTQGLFNSRFKLAITATDVRRDGGDRVYHSYFGKPAFSHTMPGLPTTVRTITYTTDKPPTGNKKASKLIGLAYDNARNGIITRIAKHWHRTGHVSLFIMEHTRHADVLQRAFIRAGIPENDIGMYIGSQTVDGVSSNTTKEYLDWAEANAKVFIATYGMMKEGIDIPRLDRGMDVSPISTFEQVIGRIRRRVEGKDRAEWVTIRDRSVSSFESAYFARLASIRHLPGMTFVKSTVDDVLQS